MPSSNICCNISERRYKGSGFHSLFRKSTFKHHSGVHGIVHFMLLFAPFLFRAIHAAVVQKWFKNPGGKSSVACFQSELKRAFNSSFKPQKSFRIHSNLDQPIAKQREMLRKSRLACFYLEKHFHHIFMYINFVFNNFQASVMRRTRTEINFHRPSSVNIMPSCPPHIFNVHNVAKFWCRHGGD